MEFLYLLMQTWAHRSYLPSTPQPKMVHTKYPEQQFTGEAKRLEMVNKELSFSNQESLGRIRQKKQQGKVLKQQITRIQKLIELEQAERQKQSDMEVSILGCSKTVRHQYCNPQKELQQLQRQFQTTFRNSQFLQGSSKTQTRTELKRLASEIKQKRQQLSTKPSS